MSRKNRNKHESAKADVVESIEQVEAEVAEPMAEVEVTEVESKTKQAKPRKALADQGRGKPTAKKVINPQPTLELKKKVVREAGGTMAYANRQWEIELKNESFVFPSRQLAAMTVGDLAKAVGIELQA